ncbi:unnamed protein product [Jaminaea pallidilutea]
MGAAKRSVGTTPALVSENSEGDLQGTASHNPSSSSTQDTSPQMVAALWERARSPIPPETTPMPNGESSSDVSSAAAAATATATAFDNLHGDDDGLAPLVHKVQEQAPPTAELDKEWVGGLARTELEALLFHANSIISIRERDLGIAAAIGQALLQKNVSLRAKHEQVMTQLEAVEENEENAEPAAQVPLESLYSPPDNDSTGATPMANLGRGDYFALPPKHNASQRAQNRSALTQIFDNGGSPSHRQDGMHSTPSTPGSSSSSSSPHRVRLRSSGASLSTSHTQKQLHNLSEENEALLAQLAALQDETEDAKREGGKKLRKLNRELDSLQKELETVTQRNVELEEQGVAQAKSRDSKDVGPNESPRRSFAAYGRHRRTESLASMTSISSGLDALLRQHSDIDGSADHHSDQQRDLTSRLLDKIKELEATNQALESDRVEREGRLGAALERGLRISDEYDAVLSAHDSMSSIAPSPVKGSGGALTPKRRQRRAVGNRVLVEGRKTVRAAMNEASSRPTLPSSGTFSSLSSFSSMDSLSGKKPRRQRSALALGRPRILITPSMEDLAAKRQEQAEADSGVAGIENTAPRPLESSPRGRQTQRASRKRQDSLDPSEAGSPFRSIGRRSSSSRSTTTYRNVDPCLRGEPSEGQVSSYERYMQQVGSSSLESSPAGSERGGSRNAATLPMTLGSELGDVWGCDIDGTQMDQSPVRSGVGVVGVTMLRPDRPRLHPAHSVDSLRAPSEAASDIAHLQWNTEEASSSSLRPMQHLTRRITDPYCRYDGLEEEDSQLDEYHEPPSLFAPGALRNAQEPREEQYTQLSIRAEQEPVLWADDEDYGVPLKESEARRLGLMSGSTALAASARGRLRAARSAVGLLAWATGRSSNPRRDRETARPAAAAIQTAEQIEAQKQQEELLRRRYQLTKQRRNGEVSLFEDGLEEEDEVDWRSRMLASAASPKRDRRSWYEKPLQTSVASSSPQVDHAAPGQQKKKGRSAPATERQVARREQLVRRATETLNEVTAWMSLFLVLILAFVVSASRGPKRVLEGSRYESEGGRERERERQRGWNRDGKARHEGAARDRGAVQGSSDSGEMELARLATSKIRRRGGRVGD